MSSRLAPLALVLTLLVGIAAGWLGRGGGGPQERSTSLPEERITDRPGESESRSANLSTVDGARSDASARATGSSERVTAERLDDPFGPALMSLAREGILAGWGMARPDKPGEDEASKGLDRFELETRALPFQIGRELAKRRSDAELAVEDAKTGGVFSVIDRLMDGTSAGPLFEVVDSSSVFDEFFRTTTQAPSIDGMSAMRSAEPPADGTTWIFPSGVFELEDFGSKNAWRKRFPRDLTIKGAGRDTTLLVMRSALSAYQRVRNLSIENCTIHADDNYVFDIRQPSMSLTIRRARLVGWITGAGASCLFGTEGLALRCIDTEITGVYSRTMRWGQFFDIRHGGLLARFENCTIEATRPFESFHDGGTVVFVNCRFQNLLRRGPPRLPGGVRLIGSPLQWFEGDDPETLKRDLNELFPNWKERMERR